MTLYQAHLADYAERFFPHEDLRLHIINAKRAIDQRFAEDLSLETLANTAFISKFHFLRLFKQFYGRTPFQYLLSVRIEAAKKLLRAGASPSSACFEVSFKSQSSFCSLFKKSTGYTPAAFRKIATTKKKL